MIWSRWTCVSSDRDVTGFFLLSFLFFSAEFYRVLPSFALLLQGLVEMMFLWTKDDFTGLCYLVFVGLGFFFTEFYRVSRFSYWGSCFVSNPRRVFTGFLLSFHFCSNLNRHLPSFTEFYVEVATFLVATEDVTGFLPSFLFFFTEFYRVFRCCYKGSLKWYFFYWFFYLVFSNLNRVDRAIDFECYRVLPSLTLSSGKIVAIELLFSLRRAVTGFWLPSFFFFFNGR